MKRFFTFLLMLVLAGSARAQSLTPTVVATAGNYATGSSHTLSYTIGELAVTTLTSANNHLTQGFQQPEDKAVGVTQLQLPNVQVTLYPNPASETLNLWIKCNGNTCENLTVSIHDLLGRQISVPGELQTNGNELLYAFNLKSLAASMYFVRLQDAGSSLSQIIKFNKTSL